jgi:TolA-binding protein
MAFFRRWSLIWFALVFGGGPLLAAPSREDRAYAAAVAAFQGEIWNRAETEFTQFVQKFPKSTNAPQAVLLLAQVEVQLGKFPAAIARLADTNNLAKAAGLADQYVYWMGEARFAGGDFTGAAESYISLTEHFSNSPLALNAAVAAAAAFGQITNWTRADNLLDDPNGVFQRAARLDPAGEPVANGRLLQAESKCAQKDFAAAIRVLNLLNPATLTPEQDWKRSLLLCRAHLGLAEPDAALTATTNLLLVARQGHGGGWAARLAESVAAHADVLEQKGRLAEAAGAWPENLAGDTPVEHQRRAVLKIAGLAAAQNDLTNAEASLEKFLAQFPGSPAAELAGLTLGELHLKDFIAQPAATSHLATAHAEFDRLLAASGSDPLGGKAFWDRGWCHWLEEKYPESLADFSAAAQQLPPSEDRAVARFKMGDAQFAQKDFAGAQTNYQAVLADFSALTNVPSSLGGRALYQILRARLELHDSPGADDAMRELLGKFFGSELADSSRLLAGQEFSDFSSPAKAREVFRKFEAERADSPLKPQVAFAVARTFEREQNWPAAVTQHQNWLKDFPTNELRPQVEYARNWAVAQTGDEAGAFELFGNFISSSTNAYTPLALWWVADHCFRLGDTNFQAAEKNYELIFQEFPTNELAYPAQLMAGRAALGRSQPSDASHYFVTLITDTNSPAELAVQAKFGYCEALRQMAVSDTNNMNLQTATNILGQLCPMAATNVAGALAWSEIGDCNLQLGAFDAATNAYAQVLSSPAASSELRHRAQVGLGLVLEKKAEGLPADARKTLLDLALGSYLDVIDAKDDEFWTKKAGLQALLLIGSAGNGNPEQLNKFFDRLEDLLPQMKDAFEKKRAALKN